MIFLTHTSNHKTERLLCAIAQAYNRIPNLEKKSLVLNTLVIVNEN